MKKIFIFVFTVAVILCMVGCTDENDASVRDTMDAAEEEGIYEAIIGGYGIHSLYEDELAKNIARCFMVSQWTWLAPRRIGAMNDSIDAQKLSETIDSYREKAGKEGSYESSDQVMTYAKFYCKDYRNSDGEGYSEILFLQEENDVILCLRREHEEWACYLLQGYGEWFGKIIDIEYLMAYPQIF